MSTYNDGIFIEQSIDSVINQSFKNWELIIINDASADNTDKIITMYAKKDKRIRYIKNKMNKGLTTNLNLGIGLAKADLIGRLDSDDVWEDRSKLEKQIKFILQNSDYGLVGSFATAIDTTGHNLFQIQFPVEDGEIRKKMLSRNCFIHSAVILRKNLLNNVGNYDISHTYLEDYGLWLKLGKISKMYNFPDIMVKYRIDPQSITQSKYYKQIDTVIKLIKEEKENYPNYGSAIIIWRLRKLYPFWFRSVLSNKIKSVFRMN